MSFSFLPDLILPHLTDLTPELLLGRGIDFLMLDFDNTIVPYVTDVPTPEMEAWLREMMDSPVRICVVSNSHKPRVVEFCRRRGIDCITHAKKPFQRGIRQTVERYRSDRPRRTGRRPDLHGRAGRQLRRPHLHPYSGNQ